MSTTPEGKVKAKVKKVLETHGAYCHMPVVNGMGKPTLDFIGCHRGRFFGIETKAGSGRPTKRQELTMAEMRAAGAAVFLINDVQGMDELEGWLNDLHPTQG
jgi:hypothetical protein